MRIIVLQKGFYLHIEIEALNMLFIIRDGKRIIKAMIPKIYHNLIRYPNFRRYILIHQSVAYQLP